MAPTKTSLGLLFVDKKTVFIGVLVLIASFALGILIGYFGKGEGDNMLEKYVTDQFQENKVNIRGLTRRYQVLDSLNLDVFYFSWIILYLLCGLI